MKYLLPSVLAWCYLFTQSIALVPVATAQDIAPPNYADIFPPSPTATSLGKFGDTPVGLYTGLPSINIPLWEIKRKDLNLPISLSYHASGVNLNEVAPSVGTNWALNATGVVTRVTMGLPDDLPNGYIAEGMPVPNQFTNTAEFEAFASGQMDSQPDIFHFSLPGASGKFVVNYDGTVMLIPLQKIDVQYSQAGGTGISRWTITTADGNIYTLDQKERTRNTTVGTNGIGPSSDEYYSSWFLSKIETPQGETVLFSYSDYNINYRLQDSETRYTVFYSSGNCTAGFSDQTLSTTTYIAGKRLTKVEVLSSGESVHFHYEEPRYDLAQDSALTRIEVKNMFDEPVREFLMDYRYLNGIRLGTPPTNTTPDNLTRRLMLTSVTERNKSSTKPPYILDYITQNDRGQGLPDRLSEAQDHWGYFNGQTSNTTLCPQQNVIRTIGLETFNFGVSGGIRTPDASSSVVGVLNKITYPTGGYTEFDYTSHDYFQSDPPDELKPRSYNFTVIEEYDIGSADTFSIKPTVVGKTSIKLTAYSEEPINPSVTVISIYKDGEAFAEYESEDFFDFEKEEFRDVSLDLTSGLYRVVTEGIDRDEMNTGDYFSLNVTWFEKVTVESGKVIAGGARILKTTDYDPVTNKTKVKKYQYLLEDGKSSGSLVTTPQYGHVLVNQRTGTDCNFNDVVENYVWVRTPTPIYTLGMTQGSPIGYRRVVVSDGENEENGYSTYLYTSPSTHPDMFDIDPWPPAPSESREWQRGLLREEAHFKQNVADPLEKIDSDYDFYYSQSNNNPNNLVSYVQAVKVIDLCGQCQTNDSDRRRFSNNFYQITSGYKELEKATKIENRNNISVTTEIGYQYNPNNFQVRKQEFVDSKKQIQTTDYRYATDFTGNEYGSQALRDKHMHSQVLEQITTVGSEVTQRITTDYTVENGLVVPESVTNFATGGGGTMRTDYLHDDQGNVTQVIGSDGVPTSYIWGYNQTLPVAKIVGATRSQVATDGQLSTDFHAGAGSLSNTQAQTLRDRLKPAQVTVFTYDPLVGITSATDPNGRTTIYHYDDLNRLEWIESEEGHVVQKLDYQYASP